MTKTRAVLIAVFLVAFAAGTVVGLHLGRCSRRAHWRSWLSRELDLTPQQRAQMREIWSQTLRRARTLRRERQQELQRARDAQVRALLTDEQQARYNEILEDYARKRRQPDEERQALYREAEERTKRILSEPQRRKYEELIEKRRRRRRQRHDAADTEGGTGARETPRGGE